MSDYDIVSRVSECLRSNILTALEGVPGLNLAPGSGAGRIVMGPPNGIAGDGAIASLYLYRIDIAPHERPQPVDPRSNHSGPFPMFLQLRYLFAPVGEDEAVNQLMLGKVLQFIGGSPVFSLPEETPGGGGTHVGLCRLMFDRLSTEQLSLLWTSFGGHYRSALPLLVEGAAIGGNPPA